MNGQIVFFAGQTIWCAEHLLQLSLSIVSWWSCFSVVLAALLIAVGRIISPVLDEYIKLWLFDGIPPWKVRSALITCIQTDETLAAERLESDGKYAETFERLLNRIAELEQQLRQRDAELAQICAAKNDKTHTTPPTSSYTS